jgi:hypothetical protein
MAKLVGTLLALLLTLIGWGSAFADEPPKVVVVTHDGGGVQLSSSRNPVPVVNPPSVSSSVSYTRGMSREQIGSLIKVAADSIPPDQMGCLVEATGSGMDSGLLPRDLRTFTPAQMQWLAQRCQLSMVQLAPVAAEFLSSSTSAALAPTPAPAPAAPVSTEQRLDAMRAANKPASSGVSWPVVALLGLSLGGSLAAGVGLGQIIGRASPQAKRPKMKYAMAPAAAAPGYRCSVSRPPAARLVGQPLPVQLGKRYLPKPARG